MKSRFTFTLLQITVHFFGWFPIAKIIFDGLTGGLTFNPIQEIEQRLGRQAFYFMIASLACTPLNTLLGWRELIKRRRALGLYCFMYGSLHFIIFSGVDYGFDWQEMLRLTSEKPYMLMGVASALIILPLGITSFKYFMKRMGHGWQSLHRGIYIASVVSAIHFAWARKGNLATLSGNIIEPFLLLFLIIVLLALRISIIRRKAAQVGQKFQNLRYCIIQKLSAS